MIKVKEYSGHIRNWKKLCAELGIDSTLEREKREKEILVKAYQKWCFDMAAHIYGRFAFALWDDVMDLRKLKSIIDLLKEAGISEIDLTEGEDRVRIVNSPDGKAVKASNDAKEIVRMW